MFTYASPPADDKDRIRRLVGDTDPTDPQQQDEEIYDALTLEGNPNPYPGGQTSGRGLLYRAAANVAWAIAGRYARLVTTAVSQQVTAQYDQLFKHYEQLASDYRRKAAMTGVGPRTGGLSLGEKQTAQQDSDLVHPWFRRDEDSIPGGATTGDSDSALAQDESLPQLAP